MSDSLVFPGSRSKEIFESELNALVDKEKTPGIDAILEVTYSKYPKFTSLDGEDYVFNFDVFSKFSGYNLPENGEIDFKNIQELFSQKISEIRDSFKRLLQELASADYYNDNPNKKFILEKAIDYNLKLLELAEEGFVFEMEKAGYQHGLSDEEIHEKIARLESLEAEIFGGKILDNKKESELCWQFINSKLLDYKNYGNDEKEARIEKGVATRILSPEEIARLEGYFKQIGSRLGERGYNLSIEEESGEEKNPTSEFLEKYGAKKIPREVYVDMFQKCIDILGLPQKVRVTSVTGIYDGPEFLDIPDTKKYKELPLDRVMKLISHEIMGHYVNQAVHEETFGKVRSAGNVEKEEGLAKFLDTVVLGGDVSGKNAIVPNVSRILAGEILSPEEFEDFVDLYGEISEKKTDKIQGTILRHKRNYPLGYTGVQHKDVTYSRGLIKVVDFLSDGGSIHELFEGKFSIEDIENDLTGNEKFSIGKNSKIFNPVLITDVILFFLIAKTSDDISFTHNDFVKYIQEKYGKYMSDKDIEKESISQISKRDLAKVFALISPLLESIQGVEDETKEKVKSILAE